MDIVTLEQVSKAYNSHIVFENLNLAFAQGSFTAIMGRSGAGKTTLLNIIGLLEQVDSGSVCICGTVNPKLDSRNGRYLLRNKISYLFQDYGLIEDHTVEYNVSISAFFSNRIIEDRKVVIESALERVGLANYQKKRVFELSGGEQQRVAMAKILVKPSEIVLADEPTGSLDAKNERLIMHMMQDLNKAGKTIIMVTHSEAVARYADTIQKI